MRTFTSRLEKTLTAGLRPSLILSMMSAAALGCAQGQLLPAASARTIPDVEGAALAEDSGVRVAAEANHWSGAPTDLAERLTPIRVRIVNHSGGPISILYQQFALLGAHGRRYAPLPPSPVSGEEGDAAASAVHPVFAASSFFVAPRLHQVYPSYEPWKEPLPRDADFYARQYGRWEKDLPTRPMRRQALPEGVLADGGEISGFLYFENATRREKRVTFHADIDQPPQGDELTQLEIPFVVR
jgi:hypothetical protein